MAAPRPSELAAARWYPRAGVEPAALSALLESAAAALAAAPSEQKSSRRKTMHALALEGEEVDHLLKTNDYRGVARLGRLRRSKARAELARACEVAARGVPTPLPVAAGELRRYGLLERCFLLVPLVAGAVDLERRAETPGPPRERRACARELGALARHMHDAGVFQEDFAPNNFLWRPDPAPRLWAIDFERARLRAPLPHAARRFLLAKLDRRLARASAASRMRFLLAYAGGDRAGARRWWRELEAHAPRLARRDTRRWQRTATRSSRRFAPVERGAWRGWMRRDADAAALRALLDPPDDAGAPAASYLVRSLGALSRRQAARAWALAQVLWHRGGATPRPLALLRSRTDARIVFERPPGSQRLDRIASPRDLETHLALAVDRLLALGARAESLTADRFAVSVQGGGVWLLDPLVLAPERSPLPDLHRQARRCAALLARVASEEARPTPPRGARVARA